MNLTTARKQIAADIAAIVKIIKRNGPMSALELICASGLTQKRVRVRLKKARERGLLDFVQTKGATMWCEPSARPQVKAPEPPKRVQGYPMHGATGAERMKRITDLLAAIPKGSVLRSIMVETGIGKTSTKKYLHELRAGGLVGNYPGTGSVHAVWFLEQHRELAIEAYATARHINQDAQRKRKNAKRWAVKDDDEIATPDDFFERRIVPAHLAPPMVIRGPVSVFQLGAACT